MRARMNLRQCVWIVALVLGSGIAGGAVRTTASPLPQDRDQDQARKSQDQAHDQDYSKNKNYQRGMTDGRNDRAHNRDHSKKRHFKKDDDQKAYEAGYEHGRQDGPRQ